MRPAARSIFALLCFAAPVVADEPAPPPAVAGWNEFVDNLRELPARMLAKLPLSMQNDPQVRQEIGRLALEALTSSSLEAIGGDGDYPVFLPQLGQVLNVGQPNADTVYRMASITPGGTYRLRGTRGSLRMANIGQVSTPAPTAPGAKPPQPGPTRAYHGLNALRVDAQGRFDVLLSPSRPDGYTGDWWELQPNTSRLLLRMVSSDWSTEVDSTLSIQRIDRPMGRPRRTATDLEQRLRRLPAAINFIAMLFVDHVEQLRSQGYINKLKVFDVSQLGGLTGQFYYEGAYELRDDEALIVTATVPKRCVYRSMILANPLYETIDWYNNHASLNDSQAQPDSDGVLRIVVSAKGPRRRQLARYRRISHRRHSGTLVPMRQPADSRRAESCARRGRPIAAGGDENRHTGRARSHPAGAAYRVSAASVVVIDMAAASMATRA